MNKTKILVLAAAGVSVAGCAGMMASKPVVTDEQAQKVMMASFKANGQATLDRLQRDELQKACSDAAESGKPLPKDVAQRLEKAQLATVKYPSGSLLGDWKAGERIAQSGVGMQYSDNPKNPSGGNCYACHQLSKAELAYGTIGPSLHNFGKIRGYTPDIQRYAYGKVYNANAYSACSSMPRFGHQGILTEQQIKDVVALLMDPESPVNK